MKILFQDKDIIVCIKPAGVMSTDEAGGMPELIREVIGSEYQVRTVHRLDSVVSGLMVYALSSEAASDLSRQIEEGSFKKAYYAVLEGRPEKEAGKLKDYLKRNNRERKTYVVKGPGKGVEDAALLYKTVKKTRELTLVRVELITGRTHQIRAQFSSRQLPLYGDRKYGAVNTDARIALFSCSLSFKHPVTGKAMKFTALPPSRLPWNLFPAYHEIYEEEDVVREFQRREKFGDCPYAESCGECSYQGMDYAKQLEKKQKLAGKWLKKYGEVAEIIPARETLHYRNKCIKSFVISGNGRIISGNYSKTRKRLVPVRACLLENEKSESIIASIRELMEKYQLTAYNPASGEGWLKHAVLTGSAANGDMLLTLVAASPHMKEKEAFISELTRMHPEIKSIILNVHNSSSPALFGKEEEMIYGPGFISDSFLGLSIKMTGRSYFPENPAQMERLYEEALSHAGLTGKERVLHACCGSGMLGIRAAKDAGRVLLVDRFQEALKEGSAYAKVNQADNVKWVCQEPVGYIDALARSHDQIQVVFLDGTRGRFEKGIMKSLVRLSPDKIICISDDPEMLSKEMECLLGSAYKVKAIQPVDLAPYIQKAGLIICIEK